MVFLVAFKLRQLTLFAFAVIDEGLDGGDKCEDAEAKPNGEQDTHESCLKNCHNGLPPLA
jgi:hypothetical protein